MNDIEDLTSLPLMERLKKADMIARELAEHLKQAYLPGLSRLRSCVKVHDPAEVSDQEVLDRATAVLEADAFSVDLYGRLRKYLDSIRSEMEPMLFKEERHLTAQADHTMDIDFEELLD